MNYVNISGKIKKIENNVDEHYVNVRIKVYKKTITTDRDKLFIDCYFYNYKKYKILNEKLFKVGDEVEIKGTLDKVKYLIINAKYIKRIEDKNIL